MSLKIPTRIPTLRSAWPRTKQWFLCLAVTLIACSTPSSARVSTVNSPSLPEQPDKTPALIVESQFLLGVNYPWLNYGHDFGQAAWPSGSWTHDGASTPSSLAQIETDYAFLKENGVQVLRWFLFADGRASPEFDSNGYVDGLDAYFFDDLSVALSLACKYDLYIIFVLLDYYWLDEAQEVNGVQLGGHADVITSAEKRNSFLEKALQPVLERYGDDPRILAWEVINEPEWATGGIPGGGTLETSISLEQLQDFVSATAGFIQQNASQPVTLGSAKGSWLSYWTGLGLDLYSFHAYDPPQSEPPFIPSSDLNLEKPVFLGEFPTQNSAYPLDQYLDAAWENGYQGALAWSLNGDDGYSGFESADIAEEFRLWVQNHTPDVDLPEICQSYLPAILR